MKPKKGSEMSEPTLEEIGDYNKLTGEKKKIVWAVIISGLILGVIFTVAYKYFGVADNCLQPNDSLYSVPAKK
jgi:hypothetical protein